MLGELLELDALLDRPVASLSGGERQRVALARALYAQPAALLLDEPLAAVDLPRRRRIVDALARVRDELGVPIVYVTHMPEEALLIADWAVRIVGGRVEAVGAPREVIAPFSL
jgi:molybdate transport system ATP-binding protein